MSQCERFGGVAGVPGMTDEMASPPCGEGERQRRNVSAMTPRQRANLAATLVYIMLGPEALHDLADELRMPTTNRSDV